MAATEEIRFYKKDKPYFEFSNFYEVNDLEIDGKKWQTVEHYFQSQKFVYDNEEKNSSKYDEYVELIKNANTKAKAFYLGKQKIPLIFKKLIYSVGDKRSLFDIIEEYKKYVKIRNNWELIKVDVMRKAVFAKFSQNENLKNLLLLTGEKKIIEDSPRDKFWGIGGKGNGHNHLGKILMEVRTLLRKN